MIKTIKRKRISGEKVLLEPFCLEKAKEFFELYQTSSFEWNRFIALGFASEEQAKSYITQQMKQEFTSAFFIIEKASGKMVGFIWGDSLSAEFVARTRAIGVAFRGRGYLMRQIFCLMNWQEKLALLELLLLLTKKTPMQLS